MHETERKKEENQFISIKQKWIETDLQNALQLIH